MNRATPTAPRGSWPWTATPPFVDPLIALSFVAAATERIRLGTGVNILTQTNPLYLAKQASSIDHLSGGRLMLGLGVGWLAEEFHALGVPFERRGARADEYLDAMRQAWSGETVEARGDFVDWSGFKMLPRPAQEPGVPIVVGGTTDAAIRRVVTRGDGWYVIHPDLDGLRRQHDPPTGRVRAPGARPGRDRDHGLLEPPSGRPRGLEVYAEHGVSRVLVNLAALRMGRTEEAARRFADEVLSQIPSPA